MLLRSFVLSNRKKRIKAAYSDMLGQTDINESDKERLVKTERLKENGDKMEGMRSMQRQDTVLGLCSQVLKSSIESRQASPKSNAIQVPNFEF